jgi:hypothetical protein
LKSFCATKSEALESVNKNNAPTAAQSDDMDFAPDSGVGEIKLSITPFAGLA